MAQGLMFAVFVIDNAEQDLSQWVSNLLYNEHQFQKL